MFPFEPFLDAMDSMISNPVVTSDASNRLAGRDTCANRWNIGILQLRERAVFTSWVVVVGVAVQNILASRHPLKIVRSVVSLIEVFVVYIATFGRWFAVKGSADENVDARLHHTLESPYGDVQVAARGWRWFENIVGPRPSTGEIASYATKIRHGIDAFVSYNVFPDFIRKFFGGKLSISHKQKTSPFVIGQGFRTALTVRRPVFLF